MAMWKNDDEMFALMKEKLYTVPHQRLRETGGCAV